MEFGNLLTEDQAYEQQDGTKLIQYNRNKHSGEIKTIKVVIGDVKTKSGGTTKMMFGIWANWNNNDWDCLGYGLDTE